jgi:lactate dehydrogenase-like 2-hydroxyacid dehydrogenase
MILAQNTIPDVSWRRVMKIVILDGHAVNPGDLTWDPVRALGDLEIFARTAEREIVSRARETDILLTTRTTLSGQTLRELKRLRYIGAIFTGYDEIDLEAARELNITVTNVPTYGTASVAQLVFALLLELSMWRSITRRLTLASGHDRLILAFGKRPWWSSRARRWGS